MVVLIQYDLCNIFVMTQFDNFRLAWVDMHLSWTQLELIIFNKSIFTHHPLQFMDHASL